MTNLVEMDTTSLEQFSKEDLMLGVVSKILQEKHDCNLDFKKALEAAQDALDSGFLGKSLDELVKEIEQYVEYTEQLEEIEIVLMEEE